MKDTDKPIRAAFSDEAISFLDILSRELLQDPQIKEFPDVAQFGFFCRRKNILKQKQAYYSGNKRRIGRGMIFHIAPTNVPVMFAYSMVSGILTGNANIIRLSSVRYPQTEFILKTIERIYTAKMVDDSFPVPEFVRYDHTSGNNLTNSLSSICDVRIIWGSDETISEVRKSPLRPGAFDVSFGARTALCIINAAAYVSDGDHSGIAKKFYNDAYIYNQNACTSPHYVIWKGNDEEISNAKMIFWEYLHKEVKKKYRLDEKAAIDKHIAFCLQSVSGTIKKVSMPDNLIFRTQIERPAVNFDQCLGYAGYFTEFNISDLSELAGLITEKNQTISVYEIRKEDFAGVINTEKCRIVPIGQTLDFSLTWDGCNLIELLSKEITS